MRVPGNIETKQYLDNIFENYKHKAKQFIFKINNDIVVWNNDINISFNDWKINFYNEHCKIYDSIYNLYMEYIKNNYNNVELQLFRLMFYNFKRNDIIHKIKILENKLKYNILRKRFKILAKNIKDFKENWNKNGHNFINAKVIYDEIMKESNDLIKGYNELEFDVEGFKIDIGKVELYYKNDIIPTLIHYGYA